MKPHNQSEYHGTGLGTKVAAGIGLGGLLVYGGFDMAHVSQRNQHQDKLDQALEHSKREVKREIKTGEISPSDITIVRAPESGFAYDVAGAIVHGKHDPWEVSNILTAQTDDTNVVNKGETFILPKDVVPEAPAPKH